jgi:LDH2 family malate/lactate/ureidoglycolate dehydrogenase
MANKVYYIDFDTMEQFMIDVFKGVGVPEADARICAEVLITSDKRGIDSHGIGRLKPIYYDRIKLGVQNPVTNFEIVREGPTTAVIDGHHGMGHVIGKKSMQMAIDKAKKFGMGMVAVRNSTHYGIAGYYAIMAADQGMIGITGTNARPSIAPTFGVENMLGTSPLTFGMPTDEEFPFVLDCATSITQRGKIEVYEREGKELPEGWVIGEDGTARTDTKQVLIDLVTGGRKHAHVDHVLLARRNASQLRADRGQLGTAQVDEGVLAQAIREVAGRGGKHRRAFAHLRLVAHA